LNDGEGFRVLRSNIGFRAKPGVWRTRLMIRNYRQLMSTYRFNKHSNEKNEIFAEVYIFYKN